MSIHPNKSPLWKDMAALGTLLILFFCFHWDVIFRSKVYVNLWIFRNHLPFQGIFPSIYNSLNQSSDFLTHFLVNKFYMAEAIRKGFFPLWNPYLFCGFPIFSNGSALSFSPIHFFFHYFSTLGVYTLQMCLSFLIGGLSFFVLERKIFKISSFASLCGAIAYLFCPFLMTNIDFDSILGFLWTYPILLILLDYAFQKKKPAPFLYIALFLGFAAYTVHIHIFLMALLLCLFHSLYRLLLEPMEKKERVFLSLILTAILTFCLASAQLFPFLEFLLHSQRGLPGSTGKILHIPADLIASIYPILLQIPHLDEGISAIFGKSIAVTMGGLYLGMLPFLFSLFVSFSSLKKWKRTPTLFFVALFLFFLVMAPFMRQLPYYDLFMARFWSLYILSGSLLLAWGIDSLLQREVAALSLLKQITQILFYILILPLTVGSFVFTIAFPWMKEGTLQELLYGLATQVKPNLSLDKYSDLLSTLHHLLSLRSPFIWIPLIVVIGLLLVSSMISRKSSPRNFRIACLILSALLLTELFVIGSELRPIPVPKKELFKTDEAISFLQREKGLFRFASLQNQPDSEEGDRLVLKPNLGVVYGLYDIGGQESVLERRYVVFARRALQHQMSQPVTASGILDFQDLNLKLAGMLNVKYVLQDAKRSNLLPDLALKTELNGLKIYTNPYFLPRAFFVPRYEVIPNEETQLQFLASPDFDPRTTVILEKKPSETIKTIHTVVDKPAVEITEYTPQRIRITTNIPHDGILVLADTYYPGWKARIDQRGVPIYRANGVLRGIVLKAGKHRVEFTYEPTSLYWGARISGGTLILIGIVLGSLFIGRRRQQQKG